jgi:hypothetical protein
MALVSSMLGGTIYAQAIQAVVSAPTSNTETNNPETNGAASPHSKEDSVQPIEEPNGVTLDPASLLPDLPPLRLAKASLIGGTISKLDRVRDQFTVQVFGGGKMQIAFDTRTHIYNNGAPGSTSDLRKGDRIYVDTVLDGSTIFAKTIRLKTSTSAGESQGVVIGYRADAGELELRDLLSPRPLKMRLTPQTRIIDGDRAASASKLSPGTLVAVKFGAQNSSDVASEVSILAVPGARFTFVGTVTAVDFRLGLLVLSSSVDHKTYELSFDPSLIPADESLRPGADVTVLSRFDGNRYVARTVTVNSQNQR